MGGADLRQDLTGAHPCPANLAAQAPDAPSHQHHQTLPVQLGDGGQQATAQEQQWTQNETVSQLCNDGIQRVQGLHHQGVQRTQTAGMGQHHQRCYAVQHHRRVG